MEKDKRADGTVTVREILYYLFFSLLFFAKGIGLYDGQGLFKIFLVLAFACFVLKMVTTDYTVRELALLAVLAIVALVSFSHTREKGILFTFAIVAGLKGIPVKRVFKVALVDGQSFPRTCAPDPRVCHPVGTRKCPSECGAYCLFGICCFDGVCTGGKGILEVAGRFVCR